MLHDEIVPDGGAGEPRQKVGDSRQRDITAVLRLVESVTTSIEKDIEKYSFRSRDLENARFTTTAVAFGIYAVTAVSILQMSLRKGVTTLFSVFDAPIPSVVFVGIIILLVGLPILFGFLTRAIKLRRAVSLAKRHVDTKIDFAEQVLTRASTWEARFKGDYYQKSILKLRITVLAELLEEMYAISRSYPTRTLHFRSI